MRQNRILIVLVACLVSIILAGCKDESGELNIIEDTEDEAKIVIFSSDATHDGNLGGNRGSVDGICQGSSNRPSGYDNVHALISFDVSDDIYNMRKNFGIPGDEEIKTVDGETVFKDWGHLTDGSGPYDSLKNLEVLPPASLWWSGSNSSGNNLMENCNYWTNNTSGQGAVGVSESDTGHWMDNMSPFGCSSYAYVLCLAFHKEDDQDVSSHKTP